MSNINTAVNICGVEMKNPVTTASGTFGSGREFGEFVDLNRLGAVTVKGVVYKVTNADKKEVAATKPSSKKAKSITIKNTVTVKGVSCKVTSISAKAFTGMKKLTKVTIPKNVSCMGSPPRSTLSM